MSRESGGGPGKREAPLAALAQKTWDPRTPALSWPDFKALVNRL
ncbi:hypothetical protein [Streptomyces sp. NRRL F-4489]|nr:hypothetical protein [Streptomyces sp. NRRL F-4489]